MTNKEKRTLIKLAVALYLGKPYKTEKGILPRVVTKAMQFYLSLRKLRNIIRQR